MATDDRAEASGRRAQALRRGVLRLRAAMSKKNPLECQELVELVTAYLDGALDPVARRRFEAHLLECDGCATYLDELRVTIATLGGISDERLDPVFRARLMAAFAGTTGSW